MNILISQELWNNPIPRQFWALACCLAERGHRVTFLTPRSRWPIAVAHPGVTIEYLPTGRRRRLTRIVATWRLLRRHRPDVCLASFGGQVRTLLLARVAGVPTRVVWYHTLAEQLELDHGLGLRSRLQRRAQARFYQTCTHVVAVSAYAGRELNRLFAVPPTKVTVLHNYYADPLAGGTASVPWQRNQLVCAGRIDPSKGQDVLVRALARLRHVPDLACVFIGDGRGRPAVERLADELGIRPLCRFPGRLGPQQVMEALRTAHLSIVPSRVDNCPLVAIESLAAGRPVVAADAGGLPELVIDGVNGCLFPSGRDDILAERIDHLLTDDAQTARLAVQARQTFLDHFSLRAGAPRHADWVERQGGGRKAEG